MIAYNAIALDFEEIIGWPYVSPGTNDQNGIDCSGAFVRAYKKHGFKIAHGSNTIYRQHCGAVGYINGDASRLHIGMAVFKQRDDGNEPAKYQNDGIGNIYHIGLVTGISPIRIVHATTPNAKADSTIGQWSRYGWLDDVEYGDSTEADIEVNTPEEDAAIAEVEAKNAEDITPSPVSSRYFAIVSTPNGGKVKMREQPSKKCDLYMEIPNGETVLVIGQTAKNGATWSQVERNSRKWYIMSDYLAKV